jgi:hypothetical protein
MIVPAPDRGPAAAHLLDLWEEGAALPPAARARLLLRAATPDAESESLGDLPVGERDRRLLLWRERWFGPDVSAVERCPWCGEQVELGFAVADVLVEAGSPPAATHVTARDGYEIVFRLPTSRDLATAAGCADVAAAREAVLTGCLIEIRHEGEPVTAAAVPAHVIAQVEEAMEALDPQANIELSLRCAVCEGAWAVYFDIVSYVWDEIAVWARQVLREIHHLAAAYGWSERDILALGPARRARYLEMATGG